MTDLNVEVNVNLVGLVKYQRMVNDGLNSKGGNPVKDALKQWGMRYRAWAQERFDRFSKGGGDWPALADSTVRGRRRGSSTILRDTGTLFAALSPVFASAPGAIEERIPYGLKVGIGGPGGHPSGAATVSQIAQFHQSGGRNLPQRKVIDVPPQRVLNLMAMTC